MGWQTGGPSVAFIVASLLFIISATLTAIARLTSDALTGLPLFLLAQPVLIGALVVTAMGSRAWGCGADGKDCSP
jgi:hypothetical protein